MYHLQVGGPEKPVEQFQFKLKILKAKRVCDVSSSLKAQEPRVLIAKIGAEECPYTKRWSEEPRVLIAKIGAEECPSSHRE
jgi:methylmalonyl-CoA mutase cobalamin-binding subunit